MSSHCSVYGCYNSYKNCKDKVPKVRFFCFPSRQYDEKRREAWIRFAKRKNDDGTEWRPKKHTRICSEHFVDNRSANHRDHPSYVPTIYPKKAATSIARSEANLSRFLRAKKRSTDKQESEQVEVTTSTEISLPVEPLIDPPTETSIVYKNVSVQATSDLVSPQILKCFFCTTDGNSLSTQVEHEDVKESPAVIRGLYKLPTFQGYESVKNDEIKLKRLTAVAPCVFLTLVKCLADYKPRVYSVEDMLLMTLMKLKFGMPFSSLAVLFDMNPCTVSSNFYAIIDILYERTKVFIKWPSMEEIQKEMPDSFRNSYPDTRAIIDCTEVKCEKPQRTSKQNVLYSYYKSGHTVKFFIAITPDGLISFVSKAFGGRMSDKYITNNCGFLDLLDPDDQIMADKGFPQIKGRRPWIIPPRAKRGQVQFPVADMEETKKIASVRIHVERAIQRMKVYRVLSHRVPINLLQVIEKIFSICAALVNLQSPILKSNVRNEEDEDDATIIDETEYLDDSESEDDSTADETE